MIINPFWSCFNKGFLLIILILCAFNSFAQEAFRNNNTGKFGLKEGQKTVIKAKYDKLDVVDTNRILVQQDSLYGLLDFQENVIIPFSTKTLWHGIYQGKSRVFHIDGSYILYNTDGKLLLEMEVPDHFKFNMNGTFFSPIHSYVHVNYNHLNAIIAVKDHLYGAYNMDGEILIPFEYENLVHYPHGAIPYKKNGKWGIINMEGNVVTEAIYDSIINITRSVISVQLEDKFGTIFLNGEVLHQAIYDEEIIMHNFNDGNLCAARKNGKLGVITSLGKEQTKFIYDEIEGFASWSYDTILRITIDGLKGTITPHGKVMIPPIYTACYGRNPGDPYLVFKDHHYRGIVTHTGEVLIPAIYEELLSKKKYKGKYRVMLNGEVGLVDLKGSYIRRYDTDVDRPIPIFPNGAHVYSSYLFNNRFGIVDSAGKEIVPFKFLKIKFYNGKYGVVKNDKKYALIDGVGNLLSDFEFDKVLDLRDSLFIIKKDKMYQLITPSGKVIYASKDKLIPYAANLYLQIKPEEISLLTAQGNSVSFKITPWDFSYPLLQFNTRGQQPNVIIREQTQQRNNPNKKYRLINIDNNKQSKFVYEQISYGANCPTQFLRDGNWYTLQEDFEELLVYDVRSEKVINKYDFVQLIDESSDLDKAVGNDKLSDNYYLAPYNGHVNVFNFKDNDRFFGYKGFHSSYNSGFNRSNSYYLAALHGKTGVITFNNTIEIPLVYDRIYAFNQQNCCAVLDGKHGLLSRKNVLIIPFKYDSIISNKIYLSDCNDSWSQDSSVHILVKNDDKYAIFKEDGTQLSDFIYDDFESSTIWPGTVFKRDGIWYVVKPNGQEFVRPSVIRRILTSEGPLVNCWNWDVLNGGK